MPTHGMEAIKKYYTDTQFEYRVVWNWKLKNTPALHFGYYDDRATKHHQAVNRANEVMAEWASIKKGARIVDAGCGLGHSSIWLAQHYGARVTGITIVPKQVMTIRKFVARHQIKNVDFLVADYFDMPFKGNSVDVVWAVESLCHAADKSKFYEEAFRILKPGGKLIIAENLRIARPMNEEKEALLKELFHAWTIPDLDTAQEHQSHALNAGFHSFEGKDVTSNMMISYRNLREICLRWAWLSKVLNATGIISKLRHNNMLASSRQYDAILRKIFTYHHLMAVK